MEPAEATPLTLAESRDANMLAGYLAPLRHARWSDPLPPPSRWDLARSLIAESLVLSFAGASLGICFAWASVELLRSAMPADIPRVANIAINLRVLAATMTIAITTGLIWLAQDCSWPAFNGSPVSIWDSTLRMS
ncbi:MAG TPA: hypothetical protein VEQ63_16505 [Bryobacteraceae bacterium]|nr:hypothetical protein [Bryobacteraceae bacterium]